MPRIPHTNCVVDSWRKQDEARHYFLTHAHADHLKGMSPEWSYGTIYCTSISKALLIRTYGLDPNFIVTLEKDQTILVFLDEQLSVPMSVTAIDANHCPGSVMFLFEGFFGTILCTGDFRYSKNMISHPKLGDKIIDQVFLDTTFGSPIFSSFLSREEIISSMEALIRQHLEKDPNYKFLVGVDSLGKEDLFVALSVRFNTQIVVDHHRMVTLEILDSEEVPKKCFTTEPQRGFIFAKEKKQVTLNKIIKASEHGPCLGIVPTGWALDQSSWTGKNKHDRATGKQMIYYLPYSLHSSWQELNQFMKELRPRSCKPVVTTPGLHANTSNFNEYLNPEPALPIVLPTAYSSIFKPAFGHKIKEQLYLVTDKKTKRRKTMIEEEEEFNDIEIPSQPKIEEEEEEVEAEEPIEKTAEQLEEEEKVKNAILKFYPKSNLDDLNFKLDADGVDKWSKGLENFLSSSNSTIKKIKPVYPHTIKVVEKKIVIPNQIGLFDDNNEIDENNQNNEDFLLPNEIDDSIQEEEEIVRQFSDSTEEDNDEDEEQNERNREMRRYLANKRRDPIDLLMSILYE